MNQPSIETLREAWYFPMNNQDSGRDFDNRLESVAQAIREANGDASGYWSRCRAKEKG